MTAISIIGAAFIVGWTFVGGIIFGIRNQRRVMWETLERMAKATPQARVFVNEITDVVAGTTLEKR